MIRDVNTATAEKIVKLAKLFYEDPENVRKFEEWKKQYYGGNTNEEIESKEKTTA